MKSRILQVNILAGLANWHTPKMQDLLTFQIKDTVSIAQVTGAVIV